MINSIFIQDYQSHKETELNLSPGVNIITGESDNGKTAILRAFNWCLLNKPSKGDPRWGNDISSVGIEFDDVQVIRGKIKNDNFYRLNGSKEPFKAFGQSVPDEIKRIINMTSINVHQQMDSPFLLSMSSGEVARTLNNIVNLDIIDNVLSHANKRIKTEKQQLEYKESNQKRLEDDLKGLDWLDEADEELKKIEKLEKELGIWEEDIDNISELSDDINLIQKAIPSYDEIINIENKVDGLMDEIRSLTRVEEKIDNLETMTRKINILNTDINIIDNDLNNWEKEYNKLMGNRCLLCGGKIK